MGFCYSVDHVTVGGATAAERNIVSANLGNGIGISSGDGSIGVHDIVVKGNYIGTDLTGTLPLGNFYGVGVNRPGNSILDNVIARVDGRRCVRLRRRRNDHSRELHRHRSDGHRPLGNAFNGSTSSPTTSWRRPRRRRRQRDHLQRHDRAHSGNGVRLEGVTVGYAIRGNSIHDNLGIGIAYGFNGPTPNDDGDADTGAERHAELSRPEIGRVRARRSHRAGTQIQGVLHSTPSTIFDLDFYANDACVALPEGLPGGPHVSRLGPGHDGRLRHGRLRRHGADGPSPPASASAPRRPTRPAALRSSRSGCPSRSSGFGAAGRRRGHHRRHRLRAGRRPSRSAALPRRASP